MALLEFVGVDGEGGDIPDEYGFTTHTYTMLRAGNRLTFSRWFDFLLSLERKKLYVSYFFDYDVTMMCRDLPETALRVLVSSQPVRIGRVDLHYRPRKEFTLRGNGRQVTINDVGTFFQSTFVTALRRWRIGTDTQLAAIEDGKQQRGGHGDVTPRIIEYNRMECELLVQLMDKFRRTCIAVGYLPQRWQGPGQLSKAMLRAHGIPKTRDLPEPVIAGVWEAAQAAYYGGRFETSAVGSIRHPVDGWDINSAYPAACTNLPCLSHVEWRKAGTTVTSRGLYQVDYAHRRGQRWHGLPHRAHDGRIVYPRTGAGWYWGVEILAAQKLGARVKVRRGFEYIQHCDHRLFDFVHRVYAMRRAVGKSEAGLALKLALNSLYGVFAQSIGDPPYANPVYAGLITAMTRAKLIDAMALSPDDVYMVATDGIYTAPGLPLEKSEELGGWDHKHYPDGMHIVMPGVYFAGADDVTRTRGIPISAIRRHRESLIGSYRGQRQDGITVPLRQFIPLRLAVARDDIPSAGQWVDTSKRISYDWSTKRKPNVLQHTRIGDRTMPYDVGEGYESTPYDRAIGGHLLHDLERLEYTDLPDWADTLAELS